jgi:hypothetical protein
MAKIVVYSCVTGGFDPLQAEQNWGEADWVMFSDQPMQGGKWQVRPAKRLFSDPRRDARLYKTIPHELFPNHDYHIWIDGSVELRKSPERLVQDYLHHDTIAVLTHPDRNCMYDEAEACKALNLDDHAVIDKQVAKYRQEGYPVNNKLGETRVLVRGNHPLIHQFNNLWSHEILNNSLRDQISFNYCAWKLGIPIDYMRDWKNNSDLIYHHHPKR